MDTHLPIGIFDSGLGGLTIVKAMQALLPGESLVYVGDTAHLPYGDKSPELIRGFARGIARFLRKQPVKAIVIACNTASAVAREVVVSEAGELPVFDVIRPAVAAAVAQTENGRVAVIGTKTTIHSGVYKKELHALNRKLKVVEKATPLLVPMIEEGWLHNQVSQDVIDAYMSDTGFKDIDTLILGCTHYPLIKDQIEKYFRQAYAHRIHVIDSSEAVAGRVREALQAQHLLRTGKKKASHAYFLSDFSDHFQEAAKLFLEREVAFERVKL